MNLIFIQYSTRKKYYKSRNSQNEQREDYEKIAKIYGKISQCDVWEYVHCG